MEYVGDFVKPTCKLFHEWKQYRKLVLKLQDNDAGENKKLEKHLNSAECKLGAEVKFTGKVTPQQSYLVKLCFAMLAKKGMAMMTKAHLPQDTRLRLYKEAIMCTTLLDNLTTKTINGKTATRYEHFHNKKPAFVQNS